MSRKADQQHSVYTSLNFLPWKGTNGLINDAAPVVKKEGRHTAYAVLRGCSLSLINVHFYNFHLPCVLPGQFIQNWFKSSAVPSPGSRKLNENRAVESRYLVGKASI
jgi:hypothetical protein